ncbi:MAG: hypothetical protein K6G22_00810 [Lachnospiraceae bacterium]|nr:hypothetical protein [Lachnospiraceae bacterium]
MKKTLALSVLTLSLLAASIAPAQDVYAKAQAEKDTVLDTEAFKSSVKDRLFKKTKKNEWLSDQDYVLDDPAPENLKELKEAVDVTDPRSVAAYYVWSVNMLTKNYDDGMAMMKYLFADIEPNGRGYTEGGVSGKTGWASFFNDRLKDKNYSWLPQAYFEGGSRKNNFEPDTPVTIELYYNNTNTETINEQTFDSLGRLNIVYWVKSHAAGNQVNITLSRFEGTDRWYVTSGTSSTALFYQQ